MSPEHPLIIDLNPRERRVYDRLRAQIVEPEPGERSNVRDLLLLLPDLAVLLFRLMRDDRVPVGSKAIAVLGGAYLISPIDLLPAMLVGPIGLVDDLIVVGAVLSRMLNRVHPDVVRSHWSGQGDALEAIQRVTAWTEHAFGDRVRKLTAWLTRTAR
ncbi:MAG: YkvA family protein [Myxococcota bacterium]